MKEHPRTNQQKLKYRSVTIRLSTPKENISDLLNLVAQMGFVAGFTTYELLENARVIFEEQYTQSILGK